MCHVSSKPKEEEEEMPTADETNDELSSVANVCDPEKYQEVFQARHKLSKLTDWASWFAVSSCVCACYVVV